jgi:iron-sulfur cluster insertion protein
MSNVISDFSPTLTFTEDALSQVRLLLAGNGDGGLKLRVSVSGGGCSGFRYGFSFEEQAAEDDFQFEKSDVTVLIDPSSMQYLAGAEIGYEGEEKSGYFTIENVAASTACGCDSACA